ncbi:MAG: twin-arginine translocase subunit TatC [Armatimonadetes bacterium]|nr:twin-arginine translocase subunit TatC [Armatimonadota bacterium]
MVRPRTPRDRKEATFLEHLEEFRQRLIRCLLYVVAAAALTWVVRHQLMAIGQAPIYRGAEMAGIANPEFKAFGPAEALVLSVQIALVAGVILAAPLWLLEAWMFIEPALEDHERKWVVPLLPFAVLLFLGGVAFCYWMSPRAFSILLKFQKDLNVAPEFILKDYLTFFLRLLLIFGVMFELPLVIMFLSAVGLVKSAFLAKHWRIAVVVIVVVCAIVTPTPDAVTLTFLAGPMIGLYLLSIILARFVEKGRDKREAEGRAGQASSAPALSAPDPYAVYREAAPAEPDAEGATDVEDDDASTEAHESVAPPDDATPGADAPPRPSAAEEPEPENQDPQ